jgi:hypothetical protein
VVSEVLVVPGVSNVLVWWLRSLARLNRRKRSDRTRKFRA